MILFLDTISPLSEFSLIDDNKIIFSKKITEKSNEKLSECIIPAYISIEKQFELQKYLKKLLICKGPGSYTALRVGIAFLYGLKISYKLPLIDFSCLDLLELLNKNQNNSSNAMFVSSSNNQNFFCFYSVNNKEYTIEKIENLNLSSIVDLNNIKEIFINNEIDFLDQLINKKLKKIEIKEIVIQKINQLSSYSEKNIIEPIYVSNNNLSY